MKNGDNTCGQVCITIEIIHFTRISLCVSRESYAQVVERVSSDGDKAFFKERFEQSS